MIAIDMEGQREKKLIIGWREDNDIILKDISVSWLHAMILIYNEKIFIRD